MKPKSEWEEYLLDAYQLISKWGYCQKDHIYYKIAWTHVDPFIQESFTTFCGMFQDHPHKSNSGFIVKKSKGSCFPWRIYFYCMHWEGGCKESLLAVIYFMNELALWPHEPRLEYCDPNGERIVLEISLNNYAELWQGYFKRHRLQKIHPPKPEPIPKEEE